jgi:threonylcarbamoyladenosine tRNA methylthiotransferase MtaB
MQDVNTDDCVIINTCAVTSEAERQLRQTIRSVYRNNAQAKIILTGCAAELNPERYGRMDGVVGVVSNKLKLSRNEYLKFVTKDGTDVSAPQQLRTTPLKSDRVRGFLQLQNGCDQRCTYCVVSRARGVNVSHPKEKIMDDALRLLQKGYREIVLTGVNISSYGRDLSPKEKLSDILQYLLKMVPEVRRWRLSSLDPADMDDDLLRLMANEERLMPHLHESLQSGNDIILQRMRRRYSRNQVIETNQRLMETRPGIVLGADIIVGFPTETDEMYQNTKEILVKAHISLAHIFKFSPRPETPAAAMPQVEKNIIIARAKDLKFCSQELLYRKCLTYLGKEISGLAETKNTAKSDSFLPIKSLDSLVMGKVYVFRCVSVHNNQIIAKVVAVVED